MKKSSLYLFLTLGFVFSQTSFAHEKVVVIPLQGSRAHGSDKQIQYNDNGSLAGAEVYYDKANQRVGVGTISPSYLLHVKDSIPDYLVGIHNTSTSNQADGLVIRADGGDPLMVQRNGGALSFAVDRFGFTYMFGSTFMSSKLTVNNATPTYDLTVNGSAGKPGGGSWSATSDARLKTNVNKLDNALATLSRLEGKMYTWKNPKLHGNQSGPQAGFLAQDVEKVFPNWVSEVDAADDDRKLLNGSPKAKSLTFPIEFNAYLVEALKELKARNEALTRIVCTDHPKADICHK